MARLAPHLTRENAPAVLKRASGMSHREIRELVAELEPRPDVAPSVRKLPERPAQDGGRDRESPRQLGAPRVESDTINLGSAINLGSPINLASPMVAPARPALVEPLAPARYQVRFTASAELREKLERLQALLPPRYPTVIWRGSSTSPSPRSWRESFRDKHGRRCGKRYDLEFHHKHPFAHGGDHSPVNLTLMCKAHNTLVAEQDYGQEVMERFRAAASRATVPVDAYGARIVVRPRGV
jgi:hypothetical protein